MNVNTPGTSGSSGTSGPPGTSGSSGKLSKSYRQTQQKSHHHEICDRQNLRTEGDISCHSNLRNLQFASPCTRPHKNTQKDDKKVCSILHPTIPHVVPSCSPLTCSPHALPLRFAPILFFGLIGPGTAPLATIGPRQLQDILGNRKL